MSATDDLPALDPTREPPKAYELQEVTAADIEAGKPVRYCDHCGKVQITGCVGAVRIGCGYLELCGACWSALKGALK